MSKRGTKQEVFVYADWESLGKPVFMGVLHAEILRGKEIFSFEYDKAWLSSGYAQTLDPDLQYYAGLQYLENQEKPNFGMLLDSSPDRWGRVLMRRREALLARLEARQEKTLFETDYLLGLYDGHRMGGLRFKTNRDGPFLNDNNELACPPWASIKELERISLHLEEEESLNDPEYLKWLEMLVAPGSSLGGARPKAGIVDDQGGLWIAKFPSRNDESDMGGWEMVTHELAVRSGIQMSESMAKRFTHKHHTYLTKRFDRTNNGERIHYASAMTMLGHTDGQDYHDGISYLEFIDFIIAKGMNINADLEELWRRIVFSICVSNTDDHLRNHGFILTNAGWKLSPAFDINPNETGTGLKLNISENNNALDLELAMEVYEYFRLSRQKAEQIIQLVKSEVRGWRKLANKFGISKLEQEIKARAFSKAEN